jgi:toxin-antitoxin system PIN domain toxin
LIAPDANLLIYSYDPNAPLHAKSRNWMEDLFSSDDPVGIPFLCVHAFMRYVTDAKRLAAPLRFNEAAEIVDLWTSLPNVRILYPGERHWQVFQHICSQVRIAGPRLTDAAIAAIALEHNAIIHTNDRDFARFPNLRWHNPLQS